MSGITGVIGMAPPQSGTWQTTFTNNLTADRTGQSGLNLRTRMNIAGLTFLLSGPLIRVTIQAASVDGMTIDSIYAGQTGIPTGSFSGNQVQMFSAGNGSFTVAAGQSRLLDPVIYPLDKTKGFLVAAHFSGTSSVKGVFDPGGDLNFLSAADQSSITDITGLGYTLLGNDARLVSKIEVFV